MVQKWLLFFVFLGVGIEAAQMQVINPEPAEIKAWKKLGFERQVSLATLIFFINAVSPQDDFCEHYRHIEMLLPDNSRIRLFGPLKNEITNWVAGTDADSESKWWAPKITKQGYRKFKEVTYQEVCSAVQAIPDIFTNDALLKNAVRHRIKRIYNNCAGYLNKKIQPGNLDQAIDGYFADGVGVHRQPVDMIQYLYAGGNQIAERDGNYMCPTLVQSALLVAADDYIAHEVRTQWEVAQIKTIRRLGQGQQERAQAADERIARIIAEALEGVGKKIAGAIKKEEPRSIADIIGRMEQDVSRYENRNSEAHYPEVVRRLKKETSALGNVCIDFNEILEKIRKSLYAAAELREIDNNGPDEDSEKNRFLAHYLRPRTLWRSTKSWYRSWFPGTTRIYRARSEFAQFLVNEALFLGDLHPVSWPQRFFEAGAATAGAIKERIARGYRWLRS